MKALRVSALGLVVAVCLLAAAPAVQAGVITGDATALLERPGEWLGRWVARLTSWIGWGGESGPASGGPRPVTAAHGSCIDPSGNPVSCPAGGDDGAGGPLVGPTSDGDHGTCIEPDGSKVPCSP